MLAKSIVAAGIRVFGLAIAFIGVRLLLTYLVSEVPSSPVVPATTFLITLAICISLWRFALSLASFLLPAQAEPEVAATAAEMESIGFSLIGLYFALSGLNRLALCLIKYYSLNMPGMDQQGLINMLSTEAWSSVIKFLLGAVLLVGGRPLLGLIRRLRKAGLAGNG